MKKINDFWWPDNDDHCHTAVFSELPKLDLLKKHLKGTKTCIQAGGNVGVFPRAMAKIFDTVYTFEPDPENFNCLALNCPEHNIVKMNVGLSDRHEMVRVGAPIKQEENNCGAYQILGEGYIPCLMIDDLEPEACDLIYLDIEGYELAALKGATMTLEMFSPVVALEQKRLPIMFDENPEAASEWLITEFGYEVVERAQRDIILAKRST